MDNKDILEATLTRVQDWIKSADQKVSILFAVEGLFITLIFPSSVLWTKSILQEGHCLSLLTGISGVVVLLFSLYKVSVAITPRLHRKGDAKSLLYFGDISKRKLADFKEKIKKLTPEEYDEQLAEQVHTSSRIATSKHEHLRDSLLAFMLALVLLLTSFGIYIYGK